MKEAEQLKINTDRRGKTILKILSQFWTKDQVDRFQERLNILVQKITELKEMDQKVQLGEEQLVALNDSSATLEVNN